MYSVQCDMEQERFSLCAVEGSGWTKINFALAIPRGNWTRYQISDIKLKEIKYALDREHFHKDVQINILGFREILQYQIFPKQNIKRQN